MARISNIKGPGQPRSQFKKINYIGGVTPVIGRKLMKFVFGDFFVDLKPNVKTFTYDCILMSRIGKIELNESLVKSFLSYWAGFKVFTIEPNE